MSENIAMDKLYFEQEKLEKLVQKEEENEVKKNVRKIQSLGVNNTANQLNVLLDKASAYSNLLAGQLDVDHTMSLKQQSEPPKKKGRLENSSNPIDPESLISNARDKLDKADKAAEQIPQDYPKYLTGGKLRDYQLEGFRWLKTRHLHGINGILADEMGLGKTIQTIAVICHLYEVEVGIGRAFLIIGPLSTLNNWVNEFKRFAPQLPVFLYHGSKDERAELRNELKAKHSLDGKKHYPVFVTSYEVMINDAKFLAYYDFGYIIIDEGHRLKNYKCRLLSELNRLPATENNRLLLTGTPLQNNLTELWSLLNYLMPEVFSDLAWFRNYFDFSDVHTGQSRELIKKEKENEMIRKLHAILQPFLLRRIKADVDLDIPPKREVLVYAPLTKMQQQYYEMVVNNTLDLYKPKTQVVEIEPWMRKSRKSLDYAIFDDDKALYKAMQNDIIDNEEDEQRESSSEQRESVLGDGRVVRGKFKMNNPVMCLRKISIHPYLVEHPINNNGSFVTDESLVELSGKMMVLDRLIKELRARGHKVLIFSQFTSMLDLIEDYCYMREYQFSRLDGTMGLKERDEMMCKFGSESDRFLFLVSTRAGGLGINLTAADTVVIFDSDWNPQSDLQAQDRCHRIGQTKPVMVYRLVTKGTVDQKLVEAAGNKRMVEKMVIHKNLFKVNKGNKDVIVDLNELKELLESQDYEATLSAATEGQVIKDVDLEILLDRSSLLDGNNKTEKASQAFQFC